MSLQSTIGIAKVGTKSLRATVPEGIVAYLGLEVGDKLDWRMEIINGEKAVIVRKARTELINEANEMRLRDDAKAERLLSRHRKK